MMKRLPLVIPLFVLSILTAATHLPGADSEKNPAPIRALLITGGCCHDYETQKEILSAGISERAEVTWDIVHEGELYNVLKLWPQATALAQGTSETTTDPQICIWINEYGKSRVFGTTIGHHNSTMSDPVYLDLVTRGLLWATGRLGRD